MRDPARPRRTTARPWSTFVARSVPPLALLSVLVAGWALVTARSGLPAFIPPSPAAIAAAIDLSSFLRRALAPRDEPAQWRDHLTPAPISSRRSAFWLTSKVVI